MNHKYLTELLNLSLCGELDEDQSIVLQKHLETCRQCRDELDRWKSFREILGQFKSTEPDAAILADARRELRVAIGHEQLARADRSWIAEFLSRSLRPVPAMAGATGMLIIGFFIGALTLRNGNAANESWNGTLKGSHGTETPQYRLTNVQFTDLGNDIVGISYDLVTPVRTTGSIHDEMIQKVLMRSLIDEQNPGARLRTVNMIASQASTKNILNAEVKRSLITTVKTDLNAAVRREALTTLQQFSSDSDVQQAFLYVLKNDDNPGMRIQAINSLGQLMAAGPYDRSFIPVLRERMETDENKYIRIKANSLVKEIGQ